MQDEFATSHTVPDSVDCFGLGSLTKQLSWLFNMRPDSSDAVLPGQQFGLEWVDFKPNRRTIMIVHGFMSHSNASVNDSLKASCDRIGSCSEMGIKACGGGAMPGALGPYFVLTTEKVPYCPTLMQPLNYNYQRHLTKLMLGQGACTKELCVPCGPTVACDVPWRQIVEEIRKNCNDLISVCSFNGAEFPCCERFRMVDGENGPCYSFNTLQNKPKYVLQLHRPQLLNYFRS
ncbi:hypothetical protein MSG28_000524 [Choristoneura fumiferana]|uniref:Uncharacterized protein n=1 Tax=Choristoneura fumiferana TaxID=7141 RepID=A0ACC0K163_CHOFU|nr:hypothetical protein MSG28_000524 [Choristoneura fumiferana]